MIEGTRSTADGLNRTGRAACVTTGLRSFRLVAWASLFAALAGTLSIPVAVCAEDPAASLSRPAGRWQDVSIEDYRKHLTALEGLVQTCAIGRDLKSCDPTLVGLDDRIPVEEGPNPERRLVRYGWLRVLFSHAEEPDNAEKSESRAAGLPPSDSARPAAPTISQLLIDARARLVRDLEEAARPAPAPPFRPQVRDTMRQVLSGREFHNLQQASESDTLLERLGGWLNRMFENIDKMRAHSAWIGRAMVWGFFVVMGVCLAWGLLRIERRWRVRLVPTELSPAPEAPWSRDWQSWLAEARNAAAAGLWRDAIHFVYWASISRLESKRLWPADRARTPREYLALMAPDDPRQAGLASLTESFERTWYGGRAAGESDYRRAEGLASALISMTAPKIAENDLR